ncbi:MAG: polysaccharide deacetylase, partial [Lachnospiraceae bacterium]|nr:polysaccharide deacetylase [Lachnospiraceae bacterium]
YQEKLAEGIANGIDLYFHPKTMYLTFDDGPSPENTEKILDVLKEKNVKATFFMIGEYVEKYPEIARRVAEEGHVIGVHCYRHDYQVLYESVDSYVEDFQKAYDIIVEVTGTEPVFFRFPGGSVNAYNREIVGEVVEVMNEKGFIYYDWNASLEDAVRKAEPEELIAYARETTLGRKKVVMLAHDTVDNTALCLEDFIESFPDYRMEVLKPGIKPIQFSLPEKME